MRYTDPVLEEFVDKKSTHGGIHKGLYPFRVHPDDARQVYFQHPRTLLWTAIPNTKMHMYDMPFSFDAYQYAKQIAALDPKYQNPHKALLALLKRWDAGITLNTSERRDALRRSEHFREITGPKPEDGRPDVLDRDDAFPDGADTDSEEAAVSDDDAEDEMGAVADDQVVGEDYDEEGDDMSDDEFYASAWGSGA